MREAYQLSLHIIFVVTSVEIVFSVHHLLLLLDGAFTLLSLLPHDVDISTD